MKSYSNSHFGRTQYYPDNVNRITFEPLLSLQRYKTVSNVIADFAKESEVKVVTEFGSGTFILFNNYLLDFEFLKTVNQVDINENRIHSALHVISTEFNRRMIRNLGNRNPLTVNIFQGNIAELDSRVLKSDVVVGIEIIEHLFPNDFNNFPGVIFGFMKPKLIILTTPNYDFNVLFHNNGALRDPDHKFEFTRNEFDSWSRQINDKFPYYEVEIFGIGEPPLGYEDVGYCSQMAVFKRKKEFLYTDPSEEYNNFHLIGSYNYFDFEDFESLEEKIFNRVRSTIAQFEDDENYMKIFINEACEYEHESICLPLELFIKECKTLCKNEEFLVKTLKQKPIEYPLKYINNKIFIITRNECESYCDILK